MSKDQAARIVSAAFTVREDGRSFYTRPQLEARIRMAITSAVRKERERCVDIILESDTPGTPGKYERRYMLEAIVAKINATGTKRKGKR